MIGDTNLAVDKSARIKKYPLRILLKLGPAFILSTYHGENHLFNNTRNSSLIKQYFILLRFPISVMPVEVHRKNFKCVENLYSFEEHKLHWKTRVICYLLVKLNVQSNIFWAMSKNGRHQSETYINICFICDLFLSMKQLYWKWESCICFISRRILNYCSRWWMECFIIDMWGLMND